MIFDCKDEKLISGAFQYFEANRRIKEIYVSEDGQYFHSVSSSNHHCKPRMLKLFRITRAQLPKPEEKPKAVKTEPAKKPAAEPTQPAAAHHEPAIPEIDKTPKKVPPAKKKAGRPAGKSAGNAGKNAKTDK